MSDDVVIYSSATCGWAVRSYAALYEKGVAFELVDIKSSTEARAKFEKFFPYALTPGFQHGETRIWESLLINDYIDAAFPGPSLTPKTASAQAQARQWIYHCDGVLFPLLYQAMRDSSIEPKLHAGLTLLGGDGFARPSPAPYWDGAQLGLVDLAYHVLFKSLTIANFKTVALPRALENWAAAIADAPSVQRAEAFMSSLRDTNAA